MDRGLDPPCTAHLAGSWPSSVHSWRQDSRAGRRPMDVLQIRPWCRQLAPAHRGAVRRRRRGGTAASGFRLATSPPGVVRLEMDGITVTDPSVFPEPLRLARSDVATISPAPTGRFAFAVSGAAAEEHAALVSLYAERPDVLVEFTQPRLLARARRNHRLHANYALSAPNPKKEVRGLWLRTEDQAGRDRLVAWVS